MSSSFFLYNIFGVPIEARLRNLERRMPDGEFTVYFGNNNQLVIKESPIDTRGVPLLSTERVSSHNEEGLEIVEELSEMRWIDEEIRTTPST